MYSVKWNVPVWVKLPNVDLILSDVISKEHPVSGGGGVSGSRFNVRDGKG